MSGFNPAQHKRGGHADNRGKFSVMARSDASSSVGASLMSSEASTGPAPSHMVETGTGISPNPWGSTVVRDEDDSFLTPEQQEQNAESLAVWKRAPKRPVSSPTVAPVVRAEEPPAAPGRLGRLFGRG